MWATSSDDDNVYLVGGNNSTIPTAFGSVTIGGTAMFIAQIDADSGQPVWTRSLGGSGTVPSMAAAARAGVLSVVGSSEGSADWGSGSQPTPMEVGQFDL